MQVSRWLVAAAVATAAAGCSGSHGKSTTSPPATPASHGAAAASFGLVLPASEEGPTTCTVYNSGYGTQVIFDSRSLNVSGECQAWTSHESGAGYLWAYQPPSAAIDATATAVCGLRDPSGRVTATVVEDTGFAPVSGPQREKTARACASLAAAGWIRLARSGR
jgi:hypothetical protein